jgi:pycsar effector protein
MAAKHADPRHKTPPVDEVVAALGGAPLPESVESGEPDDKEARKRRKAGVELRRDAERPPKSLERFRILTEVVDQGRRLVELSDQKAHMALVVMGVLNTGVFFLITRITGIVPLPPAVKPWLIAVLAVYAVLTVVFVLHAIDCLRPRRLHHDTRLPGNAGGTGPGRHRPLGLLYWETIARHDLESYGRAWSSVRMEQLSAELVMIAHHLSALITRKYEALGRLYWGLAILVGLAALLLAVYSGLALL